jgi:copper chaperone CopZ
VALRRVDGVESADVSYETGQAVVTFDSTATTPDQFIAELERMTGFEATVRDRR